MYQSFIKFIQYQVLEGQGGTLNATGNHPHTEYDNLEREGHLQSSEYLGVLRRTFCWLKRTSPSDESRTRLMTIMQCRMRFCDGGMDALMNLARASRSGLPLSPTQRHHRFSQRAGPCVLVLSLKHRVHPAQLDQYSFRSDLHLKLISLLS